MQKKPDRHEIQIVKYPKCMNCRERMQPNTCGCEYCIRLGYYCKTCRKGVKRYKVKTHILK